DPPLGSQFQISAQQQTDSPGFPTLRAHDFRSKSASSLFWRSRGPQKPSRLYIKNELALRVNDYPTARSRRCSQRAAWLRRMSLMPRFTVSEFSALVLMALWASRASM